MSEVEYSDEIKLGLEAVANHAAITGYASLSELVAAAQGFASGTTSRDDLVAFFAEMIVDGRYDAAKLGALGDDPELVKAVADLVRARAGEPIHQSSLKED